MMRSLTLSLCVAAGLTACDPAPPAIQVQVTDSAGIRIVQNHGDPAPDAGPLHLSETPLVSIGTLEGDTLYQFSRIQGGVRLSDGSIAIVDRGSSQLRVYDGSGAFLRAFGREGAGPGEFRSPTLAGRVGDTLIIVDGDNRRISRYDPADGVLTETPIEPDAGGFILPQGVFADGSVVSGGGFFFSSASGQELSSGLRRDPTGFRRIGHDGSVTADFGQFPGLEMYFEVSPPNMSARVIPFGRVTDSAVSGDRLYIGTGDAPEVLAFEPAGTRVASIRWSQPDRSVTGADLDAYLDDALENADDADERRRIRQLVTEHPAERFPAYRHLEVDRQGNLWVAEYLSPGEERPRYRVFDPEGRQLGRITLPPRVGILEIGADYLLGRRLDEFDIEYVELFRLEREPTGA